MFSSTQNTLSDMATLGASLKAWAAYNVAVLERTVLEALICPRLNPHNNFVLIYVSPTNDFGSVLQVLSASVVTAQDLHVLLPTDLIRNQIFDQMTSIWNRSYKTGNFTYGPAFALIIVAIERQGLKHPVCMLVFNVWFCEDVEYMAGEQFGGMGWEEVLKSATRLRLHCENELWTQ